MPDLPDMATVAADLQRQTDDEGPIRIELGRFEAFCIIGQIQLAARHPSNAGDSLKIACAFAEGLIGYLPESAQTVARLGWSPEHDA